MSVYEEYAPAKVNLSLQVLGKNPDGYHALASLVVFADTGDRLSARFSEAFSLALTGAYAKNLEDGPDNLVWRAVHALPSILSSRTANPVPGVALTLEKNLPLASGLGGGSADAAACLRLLLRLWGVDVERRSLVRLALSLGADVPVCLESRASWVEGVGERLRPVRLPSLWAVLVNPGIEVPTAEVFARLDGGRTDGVYGRIPSGVSVAPPGRLETLESLLAWLVAHPNDLEEPALAAFPVIGDVLVALRQMPGCLLARLSGSGATCFGLFASAGASQAGARALQRQMPRAWVQPTRLNTPDQYRTLSDL